MSTKGHHCDIFQHVADLIGAEAKDIVFTSGATETNNMAIKGVARFNKDKKRHIITTQTVGEAA
jgi:cysteine desulfurase